jgi:hypothetical protein
MLCNRMCGGSEHNYYVYKVIKKKTNRVDLVKEAKEELYLFCSSSQ